MTEGLKAGLCICCCEDPSLNEAHCWDPNTLHIKPNWQPVRLHHLAASPATYRVTSKSNQSTGKVRRTSHQCITSDFRGWLGQASSDVTCGCIQALGFRISQTKNNTCAFLICSFDVFFSHSSGEELCPVSFFKVVLPLFCRKSFGLRFAMKSFGWHNTMRYYEIPCQPKNYATNPRFTRF